MKALSVTPRFFAGAVSFEKGPGWLKPWRLPFEERRLFPSVDETLLARAEMPAGVRLRVRTDARELGLRVSPLQAPALFDLVIEGERFATVELPPGRKDILFQGLPKGRKVAEVWLPQMQPVQVRRLLAPANATAQAAPDRRFRWVTYGSSITHCRAAHSPSRTWPAIVARTMDWNLTCLGYGGQCHLDPMIARMIRDLPADFISLKLGINVMGGASLSPRTFRPAVIGLVKIIREKHPRTPIAVISPICSPPRENKENAVGQTLVKMREQLKDAVARMTELGDRRLYSFDGLDLFGPDLAARHLPDNLHPDGDGYELLARNFVRLVARKLARVR